MICSGAHRLLRLARLAAVVLLVVGAASRAAAEDTAAPKEPTAPAGISVKEDSARWENGYGEKFFQVVGTVTNGSKEPYGAIQLRTELLDDAGKVVATVDCWNGRAEALGDLTGDAARAELAPGPVTPGSSDRFRATFLADETPAFTAHRVRVLGTLPPA